MLCSWYGNIHEKHTFNSSSASSHAIFVSDHSKWLSRLIQLVQFSSTPFGSFQCCSIHFLFQIHRVQLYSITFSSVQFSVRIVPFHSVQFVQVYLKQFCSVPFISKVQLWSVPFIFIPFHTFISVTLHSIPVSTTKFRFHVQTCSLGLCSFNLMPLIPFDSLEFLSDRFNSH